MRPHAVDMGISKADFNVIVLLAIHVPRLLFSAADYSPQYVYPSNLYRPFQVSALTPVVVDGKWTDIMRTHDSHTRPSPTLP